MPTAPTLCLLALALLGCSDLPGRDNPRLASGPDAGVRPPRGIGSDGGISDGGARLDAAPDAAVERGYCTTDFFANCEARAESQCNGGCKLATVCHLSTQGTCALIRDADACDGNSACRWSSGFCKTKAVDICFIYESQTACARAPAYESCAWGVACTGVAGCSGPTTSTTCRAAFGCKWVPF